MHRDEYLKFVDMQLKKSKGKLEKELGGQVDMIAWPFGGLPDQVLLEEAKKAGYVAAFTIVRRAASPQDTPLLLPRFLLLNSDRGKAFEAVVNPPTNPDSLSSFRPETPDVKLLVFNLETRDFLSWQETFACKS